MSGSANGRNGTTETSKLSPVKVVALDAYWEETAEGIANVLSNLRSTWYNRNTITEQSYPYLNSEDVVIANQYQMERQQLETKYVTPLKYGLGATIFLFLNFRVTGSRRFQSWRKEMIATTRRKEHNALVQTKSSSLQSPPRPPLRPPQPPPPPPSPSPSSPPPPMGYLEAKRDRDVKNALSSMRLITDALVSISVGTSGTLLLLHAHQDTMRRDFEKAPLVAGRSVIADTMCGPFLDIQEQLLQDHEDNVAFRTTAEDSTTTTTSTTTVDAANATNQNFQTFQTFTENCSRRRFLEEQIRTTTGVSRNIPVSIPYGKAKQYLS